MKDLKNELINWADGISAHKMPKWEALPDIDLYMDQVITYMERQMNVFANNEDDKIITPSMINNYVKHKQIPSPVKKKYSKEHLGYLLTVYMLKQVLPINDIANLLDKQKDKMEMSELYNSFCEIQDEAIHTSAKRVSEAVSSVDSEDINDELLMLALKLSVEANASRIAAERILKELYEKNQKTNTSGKAR